MAENPSISLNFPPTHPSVVILIRRPSHLYCEKLKSWGSGLGQAKSNNLTLKYNKLSTQEGEESV